MKTLIPHPQKRFFIFILSRNLFKLGASPVGINKFINHDLSSHLNQ